MPVRRIIQDFYERFISLRGDPRTIAAGLALGVFVGVTPTIPFHTAIIVAFCCLLRLNIAAAYLGSWIISNPLTIPLFYVSEYQLGLRLLGREAGVFALDDYSLQVIAALGWEILLPLLTGGLALAPLFTVAAYFMAHRLLLRIREGAKE